jgi:putative Mg2+ transporter-C (MgtC) family protein
MNLPVHFSTVEQVVFSQGTTTRLLMACAMGAVVGMEREWRHKASGLRTNMLLCLGCALFTVLSAALAGPNSPNRGQVAANIVQGVGFLGAGLILHTRSRVLGLTSAATIFVVAAIGMACGAGLYLEAALATAIVFFALKAIGVAEVHLPWKTYVQIYEARGTDAAKLYNSLLQVLDRAGIRLNILDRDSFAALERVTFIVSTNRQRHEDLLIALRASQDTGQVMAFEDTEQD